MNQFSPRFLRMLLPVTIALIVGVVIAVSAVLIIQARHANVSTQQSTVHQPQIPANEQQVVQTYNQSAIKQDWATLYMNTSKIAVGDSSQQQFAQMMAQQVQQAGTITSITPTSRPSVKTNPDGIIYFTINEQVIIIKNGISQTHSDIFVYILEDGAWKFWFSKTV